MSDERSTAMRAERSTAMRAAASRRTANAEARVRTALAAFAKSGTQASFVTIAAEAGVSRQFLYTHPELRAEIERQRAQAVPRLPSRRSADSDSARARLRAALEDNQRLRDENRLLKEELAVAHGTLRELRQNRPPTIAAARP
ncbi:MAG: DUF6262 family protein [Solirubrobacteraceae bacterium]